MLKKRNPEEFYRNSLRGFNAKVLLEHLFKEAGYETYPFGYESLFSRITTGIYREGEQTDTLKRIRSMPDLLVIDNKKKRVNLVEAKFTGFTNTESLIQSKSKIDRYYKYWNDSIIVVIVPTKEYVYAQYISKLDIPKQHYYKSGIKGEIYYFNLEKEFVPIYKIFPEITKEEIKRVRHIIDRIKPEVLRDK
ncbi:hypothetical protein KY366_05805 [Candidatus Woesearchaeota archaeon]|nr:hypothetical protein [Candidatus Woesearchaeota archaeon]